MNLRFCSTCIFVYFFTGTSILRIQKLLRSCNIIAEKGMYQIENITTCFVILLNITLVCVISVCKKFFLTHQFLLLCVAVCSGTSQSLKKKLLLMCMLMVMLTWQFLDIAYKRTLSHAYKRTLSHCSKMFLSVNIML